MIPDIETDDGDFSGQIKLTTTSNQDQEGVVEHKVTFANDIQNESTEINRVSAQDVWQLANANANQL